MLKRRKNGPVFSENGCELHDRMANTLQMGMLLEKIMQRNDYSLRNEFCSSTAEDLGNISSVCYVQKYSKQLTAIAIAKADE